MASGAAVIASVQRSTGVCRKRGKTGRRQAGVRRFKILPILLILEINQGREQQDHVPALVHDRGAAVRAADLAGQLVHAGLLGGLVPAQVVVAVGEVDVVFVEDGAPLEGGGCLGF